MTDHATWASTAAAVPRLVVDTLAARLPGPGGLDATMAVINEARQSVLGNGLLTVNLNRSDLAHHQAHDDADMIDLQRLWSSDPAAYPVGGRKRKANTAWTNHLLRQGLVFVGEGQAALQQAFDDHETIWSLGLRGVVNVPLLSEAGRCFATFNVLGTHGTWHADQVAFIRLLALLATPAVRLAGLAEGSVLNPV